MKAVALLALDVVAAVGEVAVVEAGEETIQDVIVVFPVEGKPVALRIFVGLQRTVAELAELAVDVGAAVVVEEVRNLDIEVPDLAEEHPEADLALEGPACAVGFHVVRAVVEEVHCEDCR